MKGGGYSRTVNTLSDIVGYSHVDFDRDRVRELANGHARWYANVQRHLGDHSERVLEIIEFVYADVAIHFYKHGWEDAMEVRK